MNKHTHSRFTQWLGASLVLITAWLAGCATPQATVVTEELPFEQAVAKATDGLVAQTSKLPGFLAKVESKLNKRGLVVDPALDATHSIREADRALYAAKAQGRDRLVWGEEQPPAMQ